MPKYEDKKIRAAYPNTSTQYAINISNEYAESDTKGKYVVFLSPSGTLELWESQLDAILPAMAKQKFKGILKVIFVDVGTPTKQKLIPKTVIEEL